MIRGSPYPKEVCIQIITEKEKPDYDSPLRAFRYIHSKMAFRKVLIQETRNKTDTSISILDLHIPIRSEASAVSPAEMF
jgi:hypothetical protein